MIKGLLLLSPSQLTQDIQVRSNEAQRETRRKEKLDRELKQSKLELEQKAGDIKTMQMQAQRYKDDIGRLETQLKEQKVKEESTIFSSHLLIGTTGGKKTNAEARGCFRFFA